MAQSIAKLKMSEITSPSTIITSSSSSCGNEAVNQVTQEEEKLKEEAKLKEETEKVKKELESIRSSSNEEVKTLLKTPFLIVIRGNTSTVDVVHALATPETSVGADGDVTDHRSAIFTDLGERHCVIFRRQETIFEEDEDFAARKRWKVRIGCVTSQSKVEVNNKKIDGECDITNGDVITVDNKYVIMYKDPNVVDMKVSPQKVVSSVQNKEELVVTSQTKPEIPQIKSELSFDVKESDLVLKEVFGYFTNLDKQEMIGSKIYPATCICMCVLHTVLNNTDDCNDFILKVATSLNDVVTVSFI